jgi:hypothetical protein
LDREKGPRKRTTNEAASGASGACAEQLGPFRKEDIYITKKAMAPPQQATPVMAQARRTDVEKIGATTSLVGTMKASSDWVNAPSAVQTATTAWSAAATAIASNATTIAQLRSQLAQAEAAQRTLRRKWSDAARQILGTIAAWCDGSADMVTRLGFGVMSHAALGPLAVPSNLTTALGTMPGESTVKWAAGNARHGFLVQHATDVTNVATYSVPVPCTKSRYTLEAATSASVVHFRVAAIDPSSKTGSTVWSDWVAGTVR